MKIQFRSVCLSAHLDSFCRQLNELMSLEFVYQYDDPGKTRRKIGWTAEATYQSGPMTKEAEMRACECDILIDMLRELDIMEKRVAASKTTIYMSERWLKPLVVGRVRVPAILRLLSPSYRRMVCRFVRLMDNPNFWMLPCGVHAARDFVRLYKLFHGGWRFLFQEPQITVSHNLGACVEGFSRIRLWGYFVEPSKQKWRTRSALKNEALRVLWCGGMVDWKHTDILIRAFLKMHDIRLLSLLIVGEGKEEARLKRMAGKFREDKLGWVPNRICFSKYVSHERVRELMREADVYVMSSNSEEGWGAVVSEALAEGCPVISTYEAGSSATLLPETNLYHSNSYEELAEKLVQFNGAPVLYDEEEWSGVNAADKLMEILKENHEGNRQD